MRRLLTLKSAHGYKDGPAISDEDGVLLPTHVIDEAIIKMLEDIYAEKRELFPKEKLTSVNYLRGTYQVFRSLRRASDSYVLNKKLSPTDIDLVNRWEGIEKARGQRPERVMRYHYSNVVLMVKLFLRYILAH